ncbi:MAG: peptidase C1 [Saprospiraceae bacterium]|nr:peptidase C1 [Saprospiraceae bacterium]
MPIRMEEDPKRPNQNQNRNTNNSGGGRGLAQLLPFILMFLFKKPKLLIPVLLVGGALYFLGFFDGCLGAPVSDDYEQTTGDSQFSFGAALSEEEFDKAEVFEALSSGYGAPSLPSRYSLRRFAPSAAHQGSQGSCVGWASAYAARTILQASATGANPNSVRFSPSFLYNQIALDGCQGAYMRNAMETMYKVGALPYSQFGYDERTCSKMPAQSQIQEAGQFRIKGFNRLTMSASDYRPDIDAMKQNLAQGAPVVIGMMVGGTFMQNMMGKSTWNPTQRDYSGYGFSGHAMCVIGYDDNKDGGSFEIMNSWGPEWGDNGVAWVKYRDFLNFTKEAYGLYPMGNSNAMDPNKMVVKFGLVDNESQTLIPLRSNANNTFETVRPVSIGQKFKVAVTNSSECYTYVFGEETDKSSYVLFPYTAKHSAYCGIMGTRVFPKDYSMTPDKLGSRDRIAVVVSKKELNYEQLNKLINSSRQSSYINKVREAIRSEEVQNVKFSTDSQGAISFDATMNGKNVIAAVIEIDKR